MKANSTLDVFSEKTCGTSVRRMSFARDGDGYALANGVLDVRGAMCAERFAQSVRLNGYDCGSVDVLVKVGVGEGKWEWMGVKSLCRISYREADGAGILDLTGDWWQVVGPWTIPGFALRVRLRLTMRPGERAFLAEIAEIENSGTRDITVVRLFISVLPPKGVVPKCVKHPTEEANAAAWDAGAGRSIGLRSEDEGVQRIVFWVDEANGCPHSDCGFTLPGGDVTLRPGQLFVPSRPMAVIVTCAEE